MSQSVSSSDQQSKVQTYLLYYQDGASFLAFLLKNDFNNKFIIQIVLLSCQLSNNLIN